MLDNRYFELISRSNDLAHVYSPKLPLAVLVNKDGTPLVGIQLNCPEPARRGLITNRPDLTTDTNQFIQGLLNSEGLFGVVITNFNTTNKVQINFNQTTSDGVTSVVDRINQINCLKPHESYEVVSDKTTTEKFLLKCLTTVKPDGSSASVTVSDDESSKTGSKGTYWRITVFPAETMPLAERSMFATAKWVTSDIIAIPKPKIIDSDSEDECCRGVRSRDVARDGVRSRGLGGDDDSDSDDGCRGVRSRGIGGFRGLGGGDDGVRFRGLGGGDHRSTIPIDRSIVGGSKAATVMGGGRYTEHFHTVSDVFSGVYKSESCILGLSVADGLEITGYEPATAEVNARRVQEMMDKIKSKRVNAGLGPQVFDTDVCVATGVGKPNIMLYPCGHCCIHGMEKAKECPTCPMCGTTIVARAEVRVAGRGGGGMTAVF